MMLDEKDVKTLVQPIGSGTENLEAITKGICRIF